jgi:hypothetical protein
MFRVETSVEEIQIKLLPNHHRKVCGNYPGNELRIGKSKKACHGSRTV